MSKIVRLQVPPFEATPPTSLAALRRPLIKPETTRCEAHCQLCPSCVAAQEKVVNAAKKAASDLGLRLSQLVEDAIAKHVARIEAEQTQLITAVLEGVLPHLAEASLRSALLDELSVAADSLRTAPLHLRKNPELDLGPLPNNVQVKIEDDPTVPMNRLDLRDGDGTTRIDAQVLINACLVRLGRPILYPHSDMPLAEVAS
ncbi:MAG: hypothetical protein ACSHX3_10925 [Litorimonas sp.]